MIDNPLLGFDAFPRFDAFRPEHVGPALDRLLEEAEAAVAHAMKAEPGWENSVALLDDTTERLFGAWGIVTHLRSVLNTPEWRKVHQDNLARVTQFNTSLSQNDILYLKYRALAADADRYGLTRLQRYIVDRAVRDFCLGGAALTGPAKTRLAQNEKELADLTVRFANNVLDETDEFELLVTDAQALAGLPPEVVAAARDAAAQDGREGWKLTLKAPCLIPVLAFAEDRNLRKKMLFAMSTIASEFGSAERDNGPVMERILALRQANARLLGFSNYADFSLAWKMAESVDQVNAFLDDLAARSKPQAEKEFAELKLFASEHLGITELQPWDTAFAAEKLKQHRYDYSHAEVKAYFPIERVLEGLFELIADLYGVGVERCEAPTWHPDVLFFRLTDGVGGILGHFYLDLYSREGKNGGAWMDVCRSGRRVGDGFQTPIIYLICNFGRGTDGAQATLAHDEITTLFHEMGHGLHHLLSDIGEQRVAGVNGIEWDAVELPSQFMENFCWEWERLNAMSAHITNGERLPRPLFDKMLASRNFMSATAMCRQLEPALFDMELHANLEMAEAIQPCLDAVRARLSVAPIIECDRFPQRFSHIFEGGYAAGYYSYKWAEVMSADVYAAFEAGDESMSEAGERFRNEILRPGSSRPMMESFCAFRGRQPEIAALLRHSGLAA